MDTADAGAEIVVAELIWDEGLRILEQAGPTHYDPDLWRRPVDLAAGLAGTRALVVRNRTRVDAALLDAAPHLQVIGRLGAGLDNVDLAACRARGVSVVYAPAANAVSVAEMTIGLLLALARRIPGADASVRAGGWEREDFTGVELAGKVLGILGFGRIGRLVAERARALGMRVATHHPRLNPDDPGLRQVGARLTGLDELLCTVDALTVHLPLTPQTRGLLGRRELALMKPAAFLVNVGRGGVVDEAALADALEGGRLAGAALDVRESEPPAAGDPVAARLARLENVILTPHVAGLTAESQMRVCVEVARDVVGVLAGQEPLSPA